jgi:hypothetical protein
VVELPRRARRGQVTAYLQGHACRRTRRSPAPFAKGEVDGHAAIELVYAGKLSKKAAAVRFWVDAKTYQPIETRSVENSDDHGTCACSASGHAEAPQITPMRASSKRQCDSGGPAQNRRDRNVGVTAAGEIHRHCL